MFDEEELRGGTKKKKKKKHKAKHDSDSDSDQGKEKVERIVYFIVQTRNKVMHNGYPL